MKVRYIFGGVLTALVVATATFVAAPTLSRAQDTDPATVIHERQEIMKSFGGAMKTIGGFVQGGVGSMADVATAAGLIVDKSATLTEHFPTGTSMDDVTDPRTGAKPVIWEKWDDFVAAADRLHSEAMAVQAVAMAGDEAALGAAFESLGNNGCGGCHQTFRQKLE